MKKHWFLRFSVWHGNKGKASTEIKGNAVYAFPCASFMPGRVRRSLKATYEQELLRTQKIVSGARIFIVIDFVIEIDEQAFFDFNQEEGSIGGAYNIDSMEFCSSIETTTSSTVLGPFG